MASDQQGENTRAVHLPQAPVPAQQPLGTPVYRTAAFAFSSSAEYAALLNGEAAGYSYSRIDNPTADAFAIAVAALEGHRLDSISLNGASLDGPTAAQAFASGMSAISTVFWTFTGTGGHVVAPAAVYGGTYGFLRHVAARFGVQTDFVDVTDTDQVRAAMRPETQIVYAETVANPTTAVADLPALAEIAHAHGALLVVDSTMAPPVICRPLEHGADLVLHSATKYLGGHSDTTGGVVSGAPGLISQVRAVRVDTGGALAPDEAFLLRRGLETLPLRVHRQCSTAMLFDAGSEGTRFGAIVTITPHGGRQAGYELADRLRVGQVATSLGGTHTVVSHVASTTHRQFDDAALAAAGMDPGAVRFSIGLEDAEDLIADVHQALDGLGEGRA
jgi:cystathionine beta-lyase/cystathionine gamma-synthase